MEYFSIKTAGYLIYFIYNEYILKINIKHNTNKVLKFIPIKNILDDNRKNISSFKDIIKKIDKQIIQIEIEEHLSSTIKYLQLSLVNKNIFLERPKALMSNKIYVFNVEYYITKGLCHKRINKNPFLSYLTKEYFCKEDILELIDKDKVLSEYIIDDYKYFNDEKKIFQKIKNEDIKIGEKLILEFHISYRKKSCGDIFCINLKWAKKYFENEITKIKNKINKLSDSSKNYDLIYLYASPIILDETFTESKSPISYMNEIRIILELLKNNKKQFNCKFECINENILEDVIINNKTKILHISSHGIFDGEYNLVVENLQKFGQKQLVNSNKLKMIIDKGKSNINKIDLVILSTCFSEDFGKLFLDNGVKNVIYIDQKTEVVDRISVLFVKYFYQNIFEGKSIEESYNKAKESLKLNKEVIKINNESCCCNHYHDKNICLLIKNDKISDFHKKVHSKKLEKCKCNYKSCNYHNFDCQYLKLFEKTLINYKDNNETNNEKKIKIEDNKYKICCCDNNIEHNEILKIKYKNKENNSYIKLFKLNGKGKLKINSTIRFYYDLEKFDLTLGRRYIIGKIFNKIMNNENYVFLYGDKDLSKTDFAESLCVYLYERKIIKDYQIFKINSEFDFEYMKNKISENTKKYNNTRILKKNVKIIKFNFEIEKDEYNKLLEYLKMINEEFCYMNNIEYYFIFIFDSKEENITKIENKITEIMTINNNKFNLIISEYNSFELLNNLIKGKNIKIDNKEKYELLEMVNYKPKKIKLLSQLLINGKAFENIKNMKNLKLTNIELNKDDSSFPLYYLLLNMPLGLPNDFLELIFDNYREINDDKNLINQNNINNWNIIKNDKRFEENFKENKYMDKCYNFIFKALKLYTMLLIFFI